jgi:membrane protease YdiL (CAAX protease family)
VIGERNANPLECSSGGTAQANLTMTNLDDPKRLRIFELLLVPAIAFSGSLLISLNVITGGTSDPHSSNLQLAYMVVHELLCIALLYYVLLTQNRSWLDLGLRFSANDLITSGVLAFVAIAARGSVYLLLNSVYTNFFGKPVATKFSNILDLGLSPLALVFVLINPFFEELIVRAFLITEIQRIWQRTRWAIFASVFLQTAYHLYQGAALAFAAGSSSYSHFTIHKLGEFGPSYSLICISMFSRWFCIH